MSKINLKTDYEDGQVLHGDELNVNNNVAMLGVNDNFDRITNLGNTKADITYVDNQIATRASYADVNNSIRDLDLRKADKTALAAKADQSEVDTKASITYVDNSVAPKANKSYVDAQLLLKADEDDVETALALKEDKTTIGNLSDLTTEDKTSIVAAINSIDVEASPIATTDTPGIVKPDGETITVDQDGTIHATSGGGGGGTTDYTLLSNKPRINNVELNGNKSLTDLGLMSANDTNTALGLKADKSTTYTKTQVDSAIATAVADKADAATVNTALEGKADKATTYTKTQVDSAIDASESETDAKLLLKANTADVYGKSTVDTMVAAKADNLSFSNNMLQLKSGNTLIGDAVEIEVATNDVVISQTQPQDDDWKIWIDSGQVNNLGSEVVDTLTGNETNFAPSVRAVKEDLNTYSTEEQRIGTYLGKPLYRKTIIGTITQRSTDVYISLNASVDIVANIKGTYKSITGIFFDANYYANSTSSTYTRVNNNSATSNQNTINLMQNISGSDVDYAITIEYTKTTD